MALLASAILGGCATGGGGVDVPNSVQSTIQGAVSGDSGCQIARSRILLRPAQWNSVEGSAPSEWTTTASANGQFSLAAPDTGAWTLEVRDTVGNCGSTRSFANTERRGANPNIEIAMHLQKSAELSGTIVPAQNLSGESSATQWTIIVLGIDRSTTPDTMGNWDLKNLPSGVLVPTAIIASRSAHAALPLATVTIQPGGQILLPPVVVAVGDTSVIRSAKGLVLTENGNVASGAGISLTPAGTTSGNSIITRADDSGRFALALPDSGTWSLAATTAKEIFTDTIRPADLAESSIQATLAKYAKIHLQTKPVQRTAIDDWEPRQDGLAVPSVVCASPVSPNQVWIGYSDGSLYLSSNGRAPKPSWSRLDSAADNHGGTIDIAPKLAITSIAPIYSNDDDIAYVSFAGTQQGDKLWSVAMTIGGLSWTDLTSRLPITNIQNVSISPKTGFVYVVGSGGTAYSSDNGLTFQVAHPASDPYQPPVDSAISTAAKNSERDQIVVGTVDGQVWMASHVTAPDTLVWTKISSGNWGTLPSKIVTSVFIDQRDTTGNTIYASFGGRINQAVWVTRDGGGSWTSLYHPDLIDYGGGSDFLVGNLSASPLPGATTLYASTEYGAFRSDDGGATWSNKPRKAAPHMP